MLGAALAGPKDITIKAEDGARLAATVDMAAGATKGVVFVHMLQRKRADWSFLSDKVARAGMGTIAVDLRGHGDSALPSGNARLVEADFQAMVGDVRAAVTYLRGQGIEEVSCAGASIGANLCLRAAADDPRVVNVVLLSAGMNYKGLTSADAMSAYGDRPALIVASLDDSYAARSAAVLEKRAAGQKHVEMLAEAGHGTKMLNREAKLEGLVMSWLLGTYTLGNGEMVAPKPAGAAAPGTVTSTGETLE